MNLMQKQKNVVSTNVLQYSTLFSGVTGVGKTTALHRILSEASPEGQDPLFLMFEDRYQHIDGIWAIKINSVDDLREVISQLANPKVKETCSCVVIDTVDKYEEMMEDFVEKSKNVEILKDVGGYGEGTQRFRTKLRYIQQIRNLGYPVHFSSQAVISTDLNDKVNPNLKHYNLKLNKNTLNYVAEGLTMLGYVFAEGEKRYITFENSYNNQTAFGSNDNITYLKKSFNVPTKIAVEDYNHVLADSIAKYTNNTTSENTLKPKVNAQSFEELKTRGLELGNLLYSNGFSNDVVKVIVSQMEKLAKKDKNRECYYFYINTSYILFVIHSVFNV